MASDNLVVGDCLELMKERSNFEFDIIYSDPPYALGSELMVRPDGKVDYKKATDFMDKWDMPTGKWWEKWFKEAFRLLKHGGYCIMFGMPRQDIMFKYMALASGFTLQEPLYWYFISSFPKSTSLEKNILKCCEKELKDKYAIEEVVWESNETPE